MQSSDFIVSVQQHIRVFERHVIRILLQVSEILASIKTANFDMSHVGYAKSALILPVGKSTF